LPPPSTDRGQKKNSCLIVVRSSKSRPCRRQRRSPSPLHFRLRSCRIRQDCSRHPANPSCDALSRRSAKTRRRHWRSIGGLFAGYSFVRSQTQRFARAIARLALRRTAFGLSSICCPRRRAYACVRRREARQETVRDEAPFGLRLWIPAHLSCQIRKS
jgi:hypothetical protein